MNKSGRALAISRKKGFTLVELMIVVAIIAVLAAIAVPAYQEQMRRGKRAAAQAQMMDIANRQHQYFLSNRAYATKTEMEANGYALPGDVASGYDYDIALGAGPPPTFTVNFTAKAGQTVDGNLSLTSEGVKTPTGKW